MKDLTWELHISGETGQETPPAFNDAFIGMVSTIQSGISSKPSFCNMISPTEGVRFRDDLGMPTAKCLKPTAVSTLFARSINYLGSTSNASTAKSHMLVDLYQRRETTAKISIHIYSYTCKQCITKNEISCSLCVCERKR